MISNINSASEFHENFKLNNFIFDFFRHFLIGDYQDYLKK